jgi:hypothetical protein
MDPIVDNPIFLMVFLFVYSVVKAIRDPQSENWDIAFDCDLHNLCSGLKLYRVAMQVHHGQLQDVLPSLLLSGFPHLLFKKCLLEDDDHSWKKMKFTLLMNAKYCYKQTQPKVEGLSNRLVDNLQYNEGIAPKLNSLSVFVHQFVDDIL